MDSQVFILNEKRNVTLTAYLQDDSQEFWRAKKRPAVVIFPGGAYAYCSDREADPVAQEYLRAGYHAFVLRYSVGWENAVWPNPLEDYDQAMELIAAHAKELIIRVPTIPTFNATKEEIGAIARFAASLPNVKQLHLLPYHRLGQDKYTGLGRAYELEGLKPPTKEFMEELRQEAEKSGLYVQIGG